MKKTKIVIVSLCVVIVSLVFVNFIGDGKLLHAENNQDSIMDGISYADQTGLFLQMDEEGNVTYVDANPNRHFDDVTLPEDNDKTVTFDVSVTDYNGNKDEAGSYKSFQEAQDVVKKLQSYGGAKMLLDGNDKNSINDARIDVYTEDMLRSTTAPAIVVFKSEEDKNGYVKNVEYNEVDTNIAGYVNPLYFYDAAYLGTFNGKVKFKVAGVTGLVDASKVEIIPYDSTMILSGYRVNNGKFYHYVTTPYSVSQHKNDSNKSGYASVQRIGNAPYYLKNNVMYYSYDGHYFYDSFEKLISDYKNNTYKHAVNYNAPYYNYYQFLSLRSETTFTKNDFDNRVKEQANSNSKLKNTGLYFIDAQKYGVNASLAFGLAVNESGWGMSNIAQSKNNIFGLNAIDSNPGQAADRFASVEACIKDFAKNWMSLGYLNPLDWRYYGPHLGDKQSGMNVKYASDPYWGEKAAAQSYILQDITGKKDMNKYRVVIDQGTSVEQIYKDANKSSKAFYTTGNSNNKLIRQYPYIVLGQKSNDDGNWYKIQSDARLTLNRNQLDNSNTGLYDFNINYAYVRVPNNKFDISNGSGTVPDEQPSKPDVNIKAGDVNGDGKLSPADYVQIKNHIMNVKRLSGRALKAADANKDNKISPADYVYVKNKIMGR